MKQKLEQENRTGIVKIMVARETDCAYATEVIVHLTYHS